MVKIDTGIDIATLVAPKVDLQVTRSDDLDPEIAKQTGNPVDQYGGVTTTKPRPGEKRHSGLVDAGANGTFSLRGYNNEEVGKAAAGSLPTERQAIAELKTILPGITAALNKLVGQKGQSADDSVCDKAAGLVLGKLRELGYDARLVDSGIHITVRVKTQGEEIIVDPTMSQFYTDGSPTDRLLLSQGGFVGTKKQLDAFFRARHRDWNGEFLPTWSAQEVRAGAEKEGPLEESEWNAHLRNVFLPDFSAAAMSHFADKGRRGSLSPSAEAVADAYQRFLETGKASDYGRAAYEMLSRVTR